MNKSKKIVLTGSIAYDRIMTFPGFFKNEILPDKIHILNVSFFVDTLKESFGGTAGNIAYNLSLLGIRPTLWGNVGAKDFAPYEKWMKKNKYDLSLLYKKTNELTAGAYIITDKADNQISGFFPGAMLEPIVKSKVHIPSCDLAIISPQNPVDMEMLPNLFTQKKIPYIFDPGQQISSLSGAVLRKAISGSLVTIGNDYEISLIKEKTGWNEKVIRSKTDTLIMTLGAKGSVIFNKDDKIVVKPIVVKKVIDPTGAGDAYRAGIIYGIMHNLSWEKTGAIASKIAVAAIGKQGTQNHSFKLN